MRKTIFFVLLCVYSIDFQCMENNGGNESALVNTTPHESECMQKLRVSKNKLEQELDCAEKSRKKGIRMRQEDFPYDNLAFLDGLYNDKQHHEVYYLDIILKPFIERIQLGPGLLLDYCYYLKHFEFDWRKHIGQLVESQYLLDECRKSRKGEGYSALGAVIIAHNVSVEVKRNVIQKLLLHGFEFTQTDRALAGLYLFDAIPVEQKAKMVFLLCYDNHEDSFLSLLPEIRNYIAQYSISLLDKEHGLCIQ